MLNFKKVIAMVLALMMMVSMVVGCGKTTTLAEETVSATTTAQDTLEAVKPLSEESLIWYFVGAWPQPGQDLVFAEVNKVLKQKINATVDFRGLDFGSYDQKMSVVIASGEDYDICFTSNWSNNYLQNVTKGAFAPLDDLLVEYAPKTFKKVPTVFWDATKIKGKIYGFINEQISARTPTLYIPQDYIDKLDLDINALAGKINPFTMNLLDPYVEKIRAAYPETSKGIDLSFKNLQGEFIGFDCIGGWNIPGATKFEDTSLKVVNQFESDEFKAYAKNMRGYNEKGWTNSKYRLSLKEDTWEANRDIIGVGVGGTYKPGGDILDSQNAKIKLVEVPSGTPYLSTGGIIATMQALNRNSKKQERAMMLLEILNNDVDLYNTLNFGIKDKHFTLDADGFLVKEGDEAQKYVPNVPWMFASNYLAYVDKGLPATLWEDTKKINSTAKASPLLGFAFDPEPVKGEIAKTSVVVDEYIRGIDLGVANEDKFNEFLAKLKIAGSDKIVVELQKQIDAWKVIK